MAYVERCGRVWRAHWLLADGVHYGSQSGFARMQVAKRFAEDREAEIRALERVPDPQPVGVTMEEWWARWLPAQDLAPATLESYAQQYRKHIRPRWGSTPVAEISSLQVAGFEKNLRALGLTSSTVVVVMTVVRDLLTDAAAEHLIPAAPAFRTARRSRRAPDDRRPGVAVDLATVQAICARLGPDESLLVLTAVFTGMRWGEVCALRRSLLTLTPAEGKKSPASGWYEIGPVVGAVHEDVHSRRYFGPPKGGRGRMVDLPPFLAERLLRHIETMGERDLLFPDTHGHPRRHTDWLRIWRPACDGRPARFTSGGGAPTCRACGLPWLALPGPAAHPQDHADRSRDPGHPSGRTPRTPARRRPGPLRPQHPRHARPRHHRTTTALEAVPARAQTAPAIDGPASCIWLVKRSPPILHPAFNQPPCVLASNALLRSMPLPPGIIESSPSSNMQVGGSGVERARDAHADLGRESAVLIIRHVIGRGCHM